LRDKNIFKSLELRRMALQEINLKQNKISQNGWNSILQTLFEKDK
jgi:hypothetical protein